MISFTHYRYAISNKLCISLEACFVKFYPIVAMIGEYIEPVKHFWTWLVGDRKVILLVECRDCWAIIPENRPDLCHRCPVLSSDQWDIDAHNKFCEIMSQITGIYDIPTTSQ